MKCFILIFTIILFSCNKSETNIIQNELSENILKLANKNLSEKFFQDSLNLLQKGPQFVTKENGNFQYLSRDMDFDIYQQRDTISDLYLAYMIFYSDTLSKDNKSYEYLAIFQNVSNSNKAEDFKLIHVRKF